MSIKHLAMRILKRKCRIRQYTTGNKISGQEVFVTDAHRVTKQLKLRSCRFQTVQQRDTAARIQYCHWFRRFVREGIHV
jgi:hypothetical protein